MLPNVFTKTDILKLHSRPLLFVYCVGSLKDVISLFLFKAIPLGKLHFDYYFDYYYVLQNWAFWSKLYSWTNKVTFWFLAKRSNLLEIEVFEWEVNFNDSSCLDSRSQNVLLRRLVIFGAKSVEIIQETRRKNNSL